MVSGSLFLIIFVIFSSEGQRGQLSLKSQTRTFNTKLSIGAQRTTDTANEARRPVFFFLFIYYY